jgi:beta-xylosidase
MNLANSQEYAIGYAIAPSPLGPFIKYDGNPIIQKGDNIFGPGHCSVTKASDGQLWMVYHQQKKWLTRLEPDHLHRSALV